MPVTPVLRAGLVASFFLVGLVTFLLVALSARGALSDLSERELRLLSLRFSEELPKAIVSSSSSSAEPLPLRPSLPASHRQLCQILSRLFQLARFNAFTTFCASFSSLLRRRRNFSSSMRPNSIRPRIAVQQADQFAWKKLSIFPRLMNAGETRRCLLAPLFLRLSRTCSRGCRSESRSLSGRGSSPEKRLNSMIPCV